MNDVKYRTMVEEIDAMHLSARISLETGDMDSFQYWLDMIERKALELDKYMDFATVGD